MRRPLPCTETASLGIFSIILLCGSCLAQSDSAICDQGAGGLQANVGAVAVHIGPSRIGQLATRACAAELVKNNRTFPLATNVTKLGIDVFAIDLGRATPVIGLETQESDAPCCFEYRIFNLDAPTKPIRTIHGGDSFHASDSDLDGQVEIWTHDSAAIDGFEGLSLAEFDAPPTIILRYSRGKLLDVNAEFQSYFDQEISTVRGQLNAADLQEFKYVDPHEVTYSVEELHRLRLVKIRVLELVWAYLYSGREDQGWSALAEMWPSRDMARMRDLISRARDRGIHAQTDGVAAETDKHKKHAPIFDATDLLNQRKPQLTPPQVVRLTGPPETHEGRQTDTFLDLVIDSAGSVRSVHSAAKGPTDPALVTLAKSWKFIPAFKDGVPVACRMKIAVSVKQ